MNGLRDAKELEYAFKAILRSEYMLYKDFLRFAGCDELAYKNGFYSWDQSQEHVGEYTSIVFIEENTGQVYLYWLKSGVLNNEHRIYGAGQIPEEVLRQIVDRMNSGWGHVARYSISGQDIRVEKH